jgi:hypothetical protein
MDRMTPDIKKPLLLETVREDFATLGRTTQGLQLLQGVRADVPVQGRVLGWSDACKKGVLFQKMGHRFENKSTASATGE